MYLALDRPYEVPAFEVHHDVSTLVPSARYLSAVRSLADQWTAAAPEAFSGLQWFFHPRDLFRPVFLQPFSRQGRTFLYVLRPDLTFRGRTCEALDRSSNDLTARFRTDRIYVDAAVFPLARWQSEGPARKVFLAKLFENTWVGESGQSYLRTGRWIDRDLTRLMTRAALPDGFRTYPYFPLRCQLNTLAAGTADLTEAGRRRAAAALEAAWPLAAPVAEVLQNGLRAEGFRDGHPLLDPLRRRWGGALEKAWGQYRLEAYLSENDFKEYRYHAV